MRHAISMWAQLVAAVVTGYERVSIFMNQLMMQGRVNAALVNGKSTILVLIDSLGSD